MVGNGAALTDDEAGPLAQYLASNFGMAVNVNKASAAELAKVPLVDEKLAAAIVSYREKNGQFAKLDDLTNVEGLSNELLRKIQNRLTVGILPKKPE
jgi:competence protein ComEA